MPRKFLSGFCFFGTAKGYDTSRFASKLNIYSQRMPSILARGVLLIEVFVLFQQVFSPEDHQNRRCFLFYRIL